MKRLMIVAVSAIALTLSCQNKGKTAAATENDSTAAVTDSIVEEADTTPMPMFLMNHDGQYMQMLYWTNLEEPQRTEDDDSYFDTWHRSWALQEMFRRNKAEYTNMLMDGKTVKIKFVDEVLKDPDGNTPSIGERHGRNGIPSLCARFDFADPKEKKVNEYGNVVYGTVIVTDGYLKSRRQLPIKFYHSEWGKEDPLPASVVKQLEEKYGLKASRSELMCKIDDEYTYGAVQFKGEYKDAPKDPNDKDRKYALALDVLIHGDEVCVNEQLGYMFSETDYGWNVDDDGRYAGCYPLVAFEGPMGLEFCFERDAPESSTVGMFYVRDGKLVEHVYEGYHNMVDEEIPVWKKDIAEMRRLYLADNPHANKYVKLTKWAHCYIDYENEWIWMRDSLDKNGAIFLRKDGKISLIGTENEKFHPSRCEKDGISYLRFAGPAGGPSYQHGIHAFQNGKKLWELFVLQVYGEIDGCSLNGKDIPKEEGQKYFDQVPAGEQITAYFKEIKDE